MAVHHGAGSDVEHAAVAVLAQELNSGYTRALKEITKDGDGVRRRALLLQFEGDVRKE